MFTRKHVFVFLILCSLLLAGCTINVSTDIQKDGSGKFGMEMIFTSSDMQSLSDMGTTVDEFCQSAADEDMPEEAEIILEEHGDETWCTITVPFASLDELQTAYTDGEGIEVNQLEIVDDKLYYDILVDMSTSGMGSDVMMTTNWKLTLPGKIESHNADQKDGNTLTWALAGSQTYAIQAESNLGGGISLPGGENTPWIIGGVVLSCLCLIVVVVIIVVIFVVIRKKKQSEEPVEAAESENP
jgi:hypothetical protein